MDSIFRTVVTIPLSLLAAVVVLQLLGCLLYTSDAADD